MFGGIIKEDKGLSVIEERQKTLPEIERRKKRVIVLAGPTGCGKSALGLMLAQAIGGEIISADSMQVYKGMDIGTAKPSKEEQQSVPHHLIDSRSVKDLFNVVDFYYEAKHYCQQIHARNRIPIVVGGSGFYIHSLLYGPPSGPPSVPKIRSQLEGEMATLGPKVLYKRLEQLDLEYAKTLTHNDKQKIVRALEIITLTGKKVSQVPWKTKVIPENYSFRCWFLHRPRESLYHRIEVRCDKMLDWGFLEEVKTLKKQGLEENRSTALSIGYRQGLEFLASKQTPQDYEKFVASFKQASRRLAKRQFTWFRKEPLFRWLDLDLHDPETAVDIILRDYEYWFWET